MAYLDLTWPLVDSTFNRLNSIPKRRLHTRCFSTRIEAPALIWRTGKTIDKFSAEHLIRSAALLDLRRKSSKDLIDDEDLEAAEEAAGLAIRDGEVAIIQTGWEKFHSNPKRYTLNPTLSGNAAEYLCFKGVSTVGIDAPSLDPPGSKLSSHRILLRKKVLVLENLRGLGRILEPRFQLLALPLPIPAAVSPVRVMAVQTGS